MKNILKILLILIISINFVKADFVLLPIDTDFNFINKINDTTILNFTQENFNVNMLNKNWVLIDSSYFNIINNSSNNPNQNFFE